MNQYSGITYRFRWAMLLIGLTCLATGLFWIASELYITDEEAIRGAPSWFIFLITGGMVIPGDIYITYLLAFLGVILICQWLFLRPHGEWRVQLAETRRPMKTAVATAAFMAMLLTGGLILTLLEINIPEISEKIFVRLDGGEEYLGTLVGFYVIGLVLWSLWAIVFYIYWKQGEQLSKLGNMIYGLIAGSFLELFVAIGVYAWNPHDEDCWCARGSYTGLVFGATVMIWAFGPGLILLFLRKQRDKS